MSVEKAWHEKLPSSTLARGSRTDQGDRVHGKSTTSEVSEQSM